MTDKKTTFRTFPTAFKLKAIKRLEAGAVFDDRTPDQSNLQSALSRGRACLLVLRTSQYFSMAM